MSQIKSFRDLEVWALAMELAVVVYKLTNNSPREELFGMTAQMRRSAVSIPANVAEGHNRRQTRPYRHHGGIALGSQGELDALMELAVRLRYASADDARPAVRMTAKVGQMLSGLSRSLEARLAGG